VVFVKHNDDVTRYFVYFSGVIVGRFVSLVRYMDASWKDVIVFALPSWYRSIRDLGVGRRNGG
jgi:hypothetical protein